MPRYNVTAPDGSTIPVDAPDGATEEQAIEFAASTWKPQNAPAGSMVDQIPGGGTTNYGVPKEQPAAQTDFLGKVRNAFDTVAEPAAAIASGLFGGVVGSVAGAGKEFLDGDFGRGTGARTAAEIQNAITYRPRNPQAQSALESIASAFDSSKLAGLPIMGNELPTIGRAANQQRPLLATVPAAVANSPDVAALQAAGRAILPKDRNAKLNPEAYSTLERAQAEGYVVPPSSVNPTFANTTLESISGKIGTAQQASNLNQGVTEALARRSVGLPSDAPLTSEAMQQVRANAWKQGYEPIAQVGTIPTDTQFAKALDQVVAKHRGAARSFPGVTGDEVTNLIEGKPGMHGGERTGGMRVGQFDANDGLQMVQVLRDEASAAFRNGENNVGIAKRQTAKAIEDQIERALERQGAPAAGILQNFREARALMAKSHSLEDAIREGTGTLDARALARQLQNGEPLSGELETIARFANTFEKANQRPGQVAGPGVHNLRAAFAAAGGGGGAMLGGPVGAVAGAAAPFVIPRMIRNRLLSPGSQQKLLRKVAPVPSASEAPRPLALEEGPYVSGGFSPPELKLRNLLTLADDAPQKQTLADLGNTIDFPLRQEVMQQPAISTAIDDFRREAARLQQIAEKAISPKVRANAAQQLADLQDEFAAGMRQLGIENAADAHGLNRKLYESGRTQLPVQKTFDPRQGRIPMSQLIGR